MDQTEVLYALEEELARRNLLRGLKNSFIFMTCWIAFNGFLAQRFCAHFGRESLSVLETAAAGWLLCGAPSLLLMPFCLFRRRR